MSELNTKKSFISGFIAFSKSPFIDPIFSRWLYKPLFSKSILWISNNPGLSSYIIGVGVGVAVGVGGVGSSIIGCIVGVGVGVGSTVQLPSNYNVFSNP